MRSQFAAACIIVAGFTAGAAALAQNPSAPAEEHAALPAGEGRDLVIRTCSSCHSADAAADEQLDRAGWKDLVDQMAGKGADATDAEFEQIVRYLSTSFGPQSTPTPSAPASAAAGAGGTTAAIAQKLDTPQARVYVATLLPHTPSRSPSGHATNRVLVYLDDGVMTRQEGADAQTIVFHRGDVRWRPASGAYVAENTSDHPIRILEIDLKGAPAAQPKASPLDPTVVDARHYKVEFENDQVRALRVHYDAHDTGAQHEHTLNRVVVYLNDQPGAKTDDVRLGGPGTHIEQNDSDQPADRIAVELK